MITTVSPSRRLVLASGLAASGAALLGPAFAAAPSDARIVAIGGVVTEILYDLGLGGAVAAVDTTSVQPPEALKTKPNVGYMRQLSAEGVLSARPTLVIAAEGAGPPDAIKLVREAGVPIVTVPEDPTEAGVLTRIKTVAHAVGRDREGEALAASVAKRFVDLTTLRGRIKKPTRALFILSLQNGRTMVAGRNTSADGMLALAGAENVASALEGFKPMTDEAIVAARPEAVVMMDNGPGRGAPAGLFEGAALSQTPAARDKRLVTMNGLYLLGFGPRTPDAARELLLALHPGTPSE
ncbi:heme/hemin ABC transporter substrate-binding protein [Enterovirga rhinocerotis]|uniref:Iron complex transport system substrate-binding protein n=1 Tax=Enterovirga rhinocerotis TaxID=1339210 RepID=A0A4R7BYY7_9HYPH|nr:hemin ABC transporter substrate-binding protein [Enterovirga rhinocerotis]TDR89266.1 iron complex transport system substrate-binding protein [Enterovirga rhinocerotis]